MNLASWIILALVGVLIAIAIRSVFFKGKKTYSGCCDTGDRYGAKTNIDLLETSDYPSLGCACSCGCKECPAGIGYSKRAS